MINANESWIDPIFDAVVSDVQRTGYFDVVNKHEFRRKPGMGLNAAVWVQDIRSVGAASGLSETAGRLLFTVRVYKRIMSEPQDEIDPNMLRAVSNVMRQFHDDYDFGGAIRNVDLFGNFGVELQATAGYLEQDKTMYRIMDITIPCIVNDIWVQVK